MGSVRICAFAGSSALGFVGGPSGPMPWFQIAAT
ncbi:DUF6053 domain-containing protein [Lysobacter enzymogenes]